MTAGAWDIGFGTGAVVTREFPFTDLTPMKLTGLTPGDRIVVWVGLFTAPPESMGLWLTRERGQQALSITIAVDGAEQLSPDAPWPMDWTDPGAYSVQHQFVATEHTASLSVTVTAYADHPRLVLQSMKVRALAHQ